MEDLLLLKQALFKEYDGFADKRHKKLDSSKLFMIDDRSPGDYGANGAAARTIRSCAAVRPEMNSSALSNALSISSPQNRRAAKIRQLATKPKMRFSGSFKNLLSFSLKSSPMRETDEKAHRAAILPNGQSLRC